MGRLPGGAADKHLVLQQLRSPGTAASPQGALTLLRKWLDLPERAREQCVTWPIVTERCVALDSMIAIAFGLDEKVKLRYRILGENLGRPGCPRPREA